MDGWEISGRGYSTSTLDSNKGKVHNIKFPSLILLGVVVVPANQVSLRRISRAWPGNCQEINMSGKGITIDNFPPNTLRAYGLLPIPWGKGPR